MIANRSNVFRLVTPKQQIIRDADWHVWPVTIPRRSITGWFVWGTVLRRREGRRWVYKKYVETTN